MQEVKAKLRFLRMSPRKMRLLADMVRGRQVTKAINTLSLIDKQHYAKPLIKLLQSAVANAKHNFSLSEETLMIAQISVDGGPALKRWMPKAHGRATPVRERTLHINLVLSPREEKNIKNKKVKEDKKVEPVKKLKKIIKK